MENKVLQIERDELSRNYKYYDDADEIKDIDICSYEYDLPALKEKMTFYPLEKNPNIGDTYILDPFCANRYILAEYFSDEILKSKRHCISDIARFLGAKHFHFSLEIVRTKKRKYNVDVEAEYAKVDGNLGVDLKRQKKLNSKYSLDEDCQGAFDEEEYHKAEELAKQYGLFNEPDIKSLFIGRDTQSKNKILHRKCEFFMSNEINTSLDIAAKLKIMKDVFSLSADFNKTVKNKEIIKGILEMDF